MFTKIVESIGVGFFAMIMVGIISFFANIYQFVVGMIALGTLSEVTPILVVKGVGVVVPPLGSVMGFLGFFGV